VCVWVGRRRKKRIFEGFGSRLASAEREERFEEFEEQFCDRIVCCVVGSFSFVFGGDCVNRELLEVGCIFCLGCFVFFFGFRGVGGRKEGLRRVVTEASAGTYEAGW
jgi:hypothetical protein